jgi:hypothetical protein
VFVYLVLYILCGGNAWFEGLWDSAVLWVGAQVFGVDITIRPLGSGDTTWNYVQLFCFLVVTATATVAWTLLDRKRSHYQRLHEWLRVGVRFWLALQMISYGAAKLIPNQMGGLQLDRLMEPFGDASPMGLLWAFMAGSAGYTMFTGAAELLGGLLLTARRTTLLGALVSVGVLSNVVMLNFCYDVPVKLLSSHLLLMAVFLVVPDVRRLTDLFLLHCRVEPAPVRPLFATKWLHRGALVLRTVLVVGFTGFMLSDELAFYRIMQSAPRPPLYGVWNVEEFEIDGAVRPPLLTDASRWQRVVIGNPGGLAIQPVGEAYQKYFLKVDADAHTLEVMRRRDLNWMDPLAWQPTAVFSWQSPESDVVLLQGTFDGHRIRARLRRAQPRDFLQTSRGFHWINEVPHNH